MERPLKLITALGNPSLVLELIDFLSNSKQYRYNEESSAIREIFCHHALFELHLICTVASLKNLASLKEILAKEYPSIIICPHAISCDDISCNGDDESMRKTVYDTVELLSAEDLVIASGGRKTITNRLIEAGLLYGCMGYLTITAPDGKERAPNIRQQTLDFNVLWIPTRRFSEERRTRIIKDELGDNFRSLYLLPLAIIKHLHNDRIGIDQKQVDADLSWLQRLPKADLHCHLGGAYDAGLLKEMAAKLLDDLSITGDRQAAIHAGIETITGKSCHELTAHDLRQIRDSRAGKSIVHALQNLECLWRDQTEPAHIRAAVLINGLSVEQIEEISRDGHAPGEWPRDLDWYMACGDLGGSTLLQTKGNLRLALRWLMSEAVQENNSFMEIRFSPDNYTRAGLSIPQVIETLLNAAHEFMEEHNGFHVNFLIMATRHKETAAMTAHVAAAVTFGNPSGHDAAPHITGFDLAGQEKDNDPILFQDIFLPLHHHFMNITIHAGEMAEDDKIWQAIYLLHARRIGHGLKLINNKKMMGYVRDHSIAIEMCPSSNIQTNGFRRFDRVEEGDTYPLKHYLDYSLTVTINTDNRGISATTLSNEYLEAARMTEGGLSRWEILRLVKNGFKAAFLPKDEKDRLLKRIDEEIFSLVLDDFFPEEQS
ncbi:MAG: hypothetical protein KJ900_17510 [Proteobacteria bacterium]|jgi:adenosine deaminase|nr:hypothetical protein [Desulfocapsa sp.]MBU3945346.1 hypothetical protein [Pseudomonadota bacterium]MBU4411528.1 hypothetical protein [Actinomycetota bacterium]MCG2743112.1 hypothetical protein [Desulfobacteraceae bacterium]MBU3984850.1 hypothetical protein [Pseudomonadota bacterium]